MNTEEIVEALKEVNLMRLKNIDDVNDFLSTVENCAGEVYLTSVYGDKFSLKSKMSRYIAMGALLGNHGDELEIFCEKKEDESKFLKFFYEHENVL